MDINSLSYKTLKNVSYSSINYGWGMIFAIFITPIIVFTLGVDRYGIYIFIGTVASLVGLIDLGFSTAVSKYVAEYGGAKKEDKLKQILYSANSLFLIISFVGLVSLSLIGLVGLHVTSSVAFSAYNLPFLFFIAGLTFFVNGVNSIYIIVPAAFQRFDITTKIGLFQTAFSSLTILLVILLGWGLEAIFLVQLFFSIVFTAVYRRYSQKILPITKFKLRWNKEEIVKCYKFGLMASVSNMSGHALSYFDKIVIPIFINPASLSYYSLSSSVASKSAGFTNSLAGILFPMVSSLKGQKNHESIKKLYIRSFRLITILGFAISLSIAIFSYKILLYWLDEAFAENAYKILIVLSGTYFVLILFGPLKNFLFGLGETKILARFSVIMAIFNVALLAVLLPMFGVLGAAISYFVSVLPVVYVFYFLEKKVLFLEGRLSYYVTLYSRVVITSVLFFVVTRLLIDPLIVGFGTLLVFGPLSVLVYLLIYKMLGFYEEEDWSVLRDFFLIFLKKIKRV